MRSPTTSSSVPSHSERFELGVYSPEQSDEALALERACPQGRSYRLSFSRDTFHRRAENFERHHLVTARGGGALVGIGAVAIKDVELASARTTAAFFFDLRVHPRWRGRGVGKALVGACEAWARERAEFGYSYSVAGHDAVTRLSAGVGSRPVGGYAYLVLPVWRRRGPAPAASELDPRELHALLLQHQGPFDLYSNPFAEGRATGVVASWLVESAGGRAGCTAWSNRGILGEVVESLPLAARLARAATGAWPLRGRGWPRLPADGEELRSWYLFDFFATDARAAAALMEAVEQQAAARGIDWCHLIHSPGAPWLPAVRARVPRLLAPVVSYSLQARSAAAARVDRLYVDVRDV